MQEKDIHGILAKVEELKSVFTFGVKFLPFLEDLLVFVQEMAPMLNEMNQSIQDSSSKMPKAVQQLDKVTSATELATNEILDKVDSMLGRLDEVNTNFNLIRDRLAAEQAALTGVAGAIEELLDLPGVREALNRVFENEQTRQKGVEIKKIVDEFLAGKIDDEVTANVENLLQDTQTDAYDIMNALQVQDITTQQIEGAHSLLRSVQERLNDLISKYSEAAPPSTVLRETKAHDFHASYDIGDDRQKAVDDMLNMDPDDLLAESEKAVAAVQETEAESELPASSAFDGEEEAEAAAGDEEPSQAEIDELLSWGEENGDSALPGEDQASQPDAEPVLEEMPLEEEAPAEEATPVEELNLEDILPENSGNGEAEHAVEEPEPEPEPAKSTKSKKSNDKPAAAETNGADSVKISQEEIDKLFQ